MPKIAVFSDCHAHPFSAYATVLPGGMNSRLADAVGCIDQIHDYCVDKGVDLVLFGGDMFHMRRSIPTQALNAVYNSMARFTSSRIPVFMIDGNHDQSDRRGTCHSLYTFQTFLDVAQGPGWYTVHGKRGLPYCIMAVPYTENLELLREVVARPCPVSGPPKIFLGHLGIQGAKVGADFVYTNPNDPSTSDLNMPAFDVGFLGHYHLHQQLPGGANFRYIGAPLQHNWGDSGQYRGFLVCDTDDPLYGVQTIPLRAPCFIKRTLKQYKKAPVGELEGHFVVVEDSRVWSEDEREDERLRHKARSLEIRQLVKGVTTSFRPVMPEVHEDVVASYVMAGRTNTDELDDDYLVDLGKVLMKEAEAQE